jgi:Mn-dependent DtxR family transcriptional regulator
VRPDTILKAQAQLPATRHKLAEKLGLKPGSSQRIAKYLLRHGYAQEWGTEVTDNGTLAAVLRSTGKEPSHEREK